MSGSKLKVRLEAMDEGVGLAKLFLSFWGRLKAAFTSMVRLRIVDLAVTSPHLTSDGSGPQY